MTQFWKVGNKNLSAEQMRAYRDGKLKEVSIDPEKEKDEIEALRDSEKSVELPSHPEVAKGSEIEAIEVTEAPDVEEVSVLDENQEQRAEFDELKEVGYAKLDKEQKEKYSKLKKLLNL